MAEQATSLDERARHYIAYFGTQPGFVLNDAMAEIARLAAEIARLRALIADLAYNGFDRGYTRGSHRWEEAVKSAGAACGLTFQEIAVLTDIG